MASEKEIMASVEKFKGVIGKIRDVLRSEGITGLDAFHHICMYTINRFFTKERALKVGIPEKFSWESLIQMDGNGESQHSLDHFYNTKSECFISHLDRLFDTQKVSFEIKKEANHKLIMNHLDSINFDHLDCHMDILGYIYENHLGNGSALPRDLGQFFTMRPVCKYAVQLVQPKLKHRGIPESMCDPAMGTFGFGTELIHYYNENFPEQINWNKQQDQIQGCDIDGKIAGVARMNFFIETKGSRAEYLLTQNSLEQGLPQDGYDIILSNMPFGLKGLKYADCCEKIKDLKIRGTKSEPLFLNLMMTSLNENGRCATVVPNGILFNESKQHTETRKYLINNFNLKKVVSLNGDFFLNTGVQTSIIFFINDGKTSEVEFCELKIKDNTVEEVLVKKVSYEQLKEKNYSLFLNKYVEEVHQEIEGVEYKKLAELCKFLPTTKHTSSIGKDYL